MWIAESTLQKVDPDGSIHVVQLRLGSPQPNADDWCCDVQIEGIRDSFLLRSHTVYGVDAWQALTLSMKLARSSLDMEIEKGCRFVWLDSDEAFDLDLVFPISFSKP